MKVTFENATVADCVSKAARVAPTKGEAFDKASGILMSLDAEDQTATLRATNLNVWYLEVVDAVEVEGTGDWRFPSGLFAAVMAKLPIGSGKQVTFWQDGGVVHMKSGTTKAQFRISDSSYYDIWDPFDPEQLEVVENLGARIQQVEWAAETKHEISFAGIHLDGEHILATDRIRAAIVPCEAEPIYKPITIPAGMLKPVISTMRDVAVGIEDGMFLMMPDVSTQIKTRTYDHQYPSTGLKELLAKDRSNVAKFQKAALIEIIDRAMTFGQNSRDPVLTFIIGKGKIAVMCSDADLGLLGDSMDLSGQADHPHVHIKFTPKNLVEALTAAPSEEVILHYDADGAVPSVKVDGGSGYMALVMPRRSGEGGGTG